MSSAQPYPKSALLISVGVQCHVGLVRSENQDRVSRTFTPFGELFIVADGVGGYERGSEAAQAAVDGLTEGLNLNAGLPLHAALEITAQTINRDLDSRGRAQDPPIKMSTTVVAAVVNGSKATVAHVGDSRAYLARHGRLEQITHDHSVVQRQIDEGQGATAAGEYANASALTQALGQAADIRLDIVDLDLLPGDALLLCSDGLWGYGGAADIEAVATAANLSPSACADALLNLALQGGGGDNIGIQYLRFSESYPPIFKRRIFGLRPGIAASWAIGCLLLAGAAAALAIWNQLHAPLKPAGESVRFNSPLPPVSPAPTAPKAAASRPVRVVRDGASEAEWAPKLRALNYLQVDASPADKACLAIESSHAVLYYRRPAMADAKRIGHDLALGPESVAELAPDSHACGAGDLFALPARSSLKDQIDSGVRKTTQSIKDRLKLPVH